MKTMRTGHPTSPCGGREPSRPRSRTERAAPCGCGCECNGEPQCCELECLERPVFFCGQPLTDQDLNALVGWTRARLGLSRFVDGWGVVCGLDVHCHPGGPAVVGVTPGYAVDCCGRDVVVCEPASIDLSGACTEAEDPCEDLTSRRFKRKSEDEPRRVLVDLAIRYAETEEGHQASLATSACGEVTDCEPTRVREGHLLVWSEGVPGESPADAEADAWWRAWEACCEVVHRFERRFGRIVHGGDVDGDEAERLATAVRRWFLEWFEAHPPQQLCGLPELVCRLADRELLDPGTLATLLFLVVQDCRNTLSRCGCPPCGTSDAVPLARVCLEVGGERRACRVVSIDPYPPYRRPLATDCWPAPTGALNFGPALWHRAQEAVCLLGRQGLTVRLPAKPSPPPRTFEELRRLCAQDPFVPCGAEICLHTVGGLEHLCLAGDRVVGFEVCPAEAPEPHDEIKVEVFKDGPKRVPAREGGFSYALAVACENPNRFPVQLAVVDPLPEPLRYAGDSSGQTPTTDPRQGLIWTFEVPAGDRFATRWTVDVRVTSLDETVTVTNRAAARATARDTVLGHARSPEVVTVIVAGDEVAPDDLTVIAAIGEARARTLREKGIATFRQLAATPLEILRELFPRVAEEQIAEWVAEARRRAGEHHG